MAVTGNQMGAYAEDQLRRMLEQQEAEKQREQKMKGIQQASIMAQNMHPETMAGLFVGQLLGDAIGRWMNGSGSWDGSTKGVDIGSEGSAGDIIGNQILGERNDAISDQLMQGMLPEQYNAKQDAKMEAFVNTDPSTVSVLDNIMPWNKKKEEPDYSFGAYSNLPTTRRLLW